MVEVDSFEAEFRAWLDAGGGGAAGVSLHAELDGHVEWWDSAVLDRDVRAVAVEYLSLAYNPSRDLTTIVALAGQPPLYRRYVVESATVLLSRYALYAAPRWLAKRLLESIYWLILAARKRGITETPDPQA
jgi:hypothetical protein